MGPLQTANDKAQEIGPVRLDSVSQVAQRLIGQADNQVESDLVDEMVTGFGRALRTHREEAASPAASASLEIAEKMVDSYTFNKETGASTFMIPVGVTEVDAMNALNECFMKKHPQFKRRAICAGDLRWYEDLPKNYPGLCKERDASEVTEIVITAVVRGTIDSNRGQQEEILSKQGLQFSDPRHQVIAAALHACKHDGQDLFEGSSVRGSVPKFTLRTSEHYGVLIRGDSGPYAYTITVASGSPYPKSK